MLLGRHLVGGDEVVGQPLLGGFGAGYGLGVDQVPVGQQLEGEHIHLVLGFFAGPDDVAEIVMGETGFDAVAGVVGQGQRDGAGGRDGAVVGEASADSGQFLDQFRLDRRDLLQVAAIAGVQDFSLDAIACLDAVADHFRALAQHLGGHGEILLQNRGRPFLARQLQSDAPAGQGQFLGDFLGENQRFRRSILHT